MSMAFLFGRKGGHCLRGTDNNILKQFNCQIELTDRKGIKRHLTHLEEKVIVRGLDVAVSFTIPNGWGTYVKIIVDGDTFHVVLGVAPIGCKGNRSHYDLVDISIHRDEMDRLDRKIERKIDKDKLQRFARDYVNIQNSTKKVHHEMKRQRTFNRIFIHRGERLNT